MRKAVRKAFKEVTGHDPGGVGSGWGCSPDCKEAIESAWTKVSVTETDKTLMEKKHMTKEQMDQELMDWLS